MDGVIQLGFDKSAHRCHSMRDAHGAEGNHINPNITVALKSKVDKGPRYVKVALEPRDLKSKR
jgi:hypothetical protein